ncbi:hypothetical protein [Photobacterium lutimaris]|nr:hypothetical protein [Photobacterium lutimaris]
MIHAYDLEDLLDEEASLQSKIMEAMRLMNPFEKKLVSKHGVTFIPLDFSQKKMTMPDLMGLEESYFFSTAKWKTFNDKKMLLNLKSKKFKDFFSFLKQQIDRNKDRTGKHDKCEIRIGGFKESPRGAFIQDTMVVEYTQSGRTVRIVMIGPYIFTDEVES